jgi:uncharacterized protein
MATVLITGGNGLIGRHLCKKLQDLGYEVAILSRTSNSRSAIPTYYWNWEKMEIDNEAIATADYIVHLAGENIGEKRWTTERKQLIIDSRVKTTEFLFLKIKEQNKNLRAFITASAVGYYGSVTTDKIFTETDNASDDFLSDICNKWEYAADKFKDRGIRTVKIRTGIVLTRKEGALAKLSLPVKMGFASAMGNGKQYLPWIHIDDLCGIYIKAIEDNNMQGVYNAVAPDHKTNKEFVHLIAQTLKKPFLFLEIPSFLIKWIFGEMSVMLLTGSRISSEKIIIAGYHFRFPDLEVALKDLFSDSL